MISTDPVVVGVDDSPGTRATLRFAFAQAAARDVAVHVVRAWSLPAGARGTPPARSRWSTTLPRPERT